jgi:hypothetical protein
MAKDPKKIRFNMGTDFIPAIEWDRIPAGPPVVSFQDNVILPEPIGMPLGDPLYTDPGDFEIIAPGEPVPALRQEEGIVVDLRPYQFDIHQRVGKKKS